MWPTLKDSRPQLPFNRVEVQLKGNDTPVGVTQANDYVTGHPWAYFVYCKQREFVSLNPLSGFYCTRL